MGGKQTPPLLGTHLHFKNTFLYMFFGCSWGYPNGCSNCIRRERNRVLSLRGRLDAATLACVTTDAQLDGERRISRIRWEENQQLELQVVHLQTCVDQSHRHLADDEPGAAQETLALQLSEDHHPLWNGLENTVTCPIVHPPLLFQQLYVFSFRFFNFKIFKL